MIVICISGIISLKLIAFSISKSALIRIYLNNQNLLKPGNEGPCLNFVKKYRTKTVPTLIC
ncbi:hypothetical protein BpHYR1_028986 [Brachionus plicatilis]|uniref:Uncharacterized protein n=1 Tax=Brachionus plicatilis TaxID=10195 RepID=A0A3M7RN56_BRAPC|nr:hypothetical protein BpHYR1_028986 [Brachionus plicatilis]